MNISKIMESLPVYCFWMKKLWHPGKQVAYFVASPTHENIGDAAIVMGVKNVLSICGYKHVVEITTWRLLNRNDSPGKE